MMRTPVEALLHILREEGVDRVFGNPGTTELPLLEALAGDPGIEYVLGVQEASVVAMADGYARATGRTAVASLHAGGGTANGLVGLLNARRSRTPLVVLAGQQDRRHLVQDPMLSADLAALARPAVKESHDVQHGHDLPVLLRRAFAAARRAPAGPVFLSVPMDLLAERTPVPVPERGDVGTPGPADPRSLRRAAEALSAAAAPAIVAGDGVGREGAVAELVIVAEALGATVYHQPLHDGLDFPFGHPLHAGMLGPSNEAVRRALSGHDAVLIAGCHAFTPHHYTPAAPIPDGTAVVQLDSDPAEIGRNFPADVGVAGAIRPSLAALAAGLRPDRAAARRRREEAAERAALRDAPAAEPPAGGRLDPAAAVRAIAGALPGDAVVVEEAITSGILLREALRLRAPGSYVHTVGGGLGHGIGAAVGSALGAPGRPVVAVLGDGCALFGLQGLWSAARLDVPVTFVVMNNGEYRTLKDTLDSRGGPEPGRTAAQACLDLAPPRVDFLAAARTFGIAAQRAGSLTELAEAVAKAAAAQGPRLVEVPITGHDDRTDPEE
ncbi:thiamine pyrophosphate-binding protein [Actinomadura sp.]|jgi:benzoylformate decarboxylase|uniref:thiamine pyrophosphate-binding protein n=1 Tax=Actinomadura sp. TaxID=1989 RepID=UPI00335056A6